MNRFEQLVDEVSDLVFVVEAGPRITYSNRAVERMLGWRLNELTPLYGLELLHPDDLPLIQGYLDRWAEPAVSPLRVRVRSRSGSYRTLEASVTPFLNVDGSFQKAHVIARDVTEQIALHEAHHRRSAEFTHLMERFEREVTDAPPLTLLHSLLETAIETIQDAQCGSVLLREPDGFHFAATVGWSLERLQRVVLPLEDARTLALRRGVRVLRLFYEDHSQPFSLRPDAVIVRNLTEARATPIAVTLCAPIFLEGELYGYISLDNLERPDAFDDVASEALILFAGQAAVSLKYQRLLSQLVRANREAERHATRQTLLARIASIINSKLDIRDVMTTALRMLGEAMQVQQAGIFLFDKEKDVGALVAQWKADGSAALEGVQMPLTTNPTYYWLLDNLRPLVIDDTWTSPLFATVQEVVRMQNMRSIILLPILINDELVGSVGVDAIGEPRKFSPEEVEFANTVCQQISVAVERARLYEQAVSQRRTAETIEQLVSLVNSSLGRRDMLGSALDLIGTLIPFDSASLTLLRENELRFVAHRGLPEEAVQQIEQALNEEYHAQNLLQVREPLIISDVRDDPFWIPLEELVPTRAWMGLPLLLGDRLLGMLNFDKAEPGFYQPEHTERARPLAEHLATALYNTSLYEEAQARVGELSALLHVSTTLNQSLHIEAILDTLSDEIHNLMGRQPCAVLLRDARRRTLRLASSRGLAPPEVNAFNAAPPSPDSGLLAVSFGEGHGMEYCPYPLPAEPSLLPAAFAREVTQVPLVGNAGEVIGVMVVATTPRHDGQRRLLHGLCNLGASALKRWQLYEQEQQRVAQVEALHRINLQMTASLELKAVLHAIARSVLKLVGGSNAHIYLYDEAHGDFEFGTYAWAGDDSTPPPQPMTQVRPNGLTDAVARQRRMIVLEDAPAHPQFYQNETAIAWGLRSIASVPLLSFGQVLGVLNIAFTEASHHFTEDELRLLELFAGQAAIAIQNARLFERERLQREGLEALQRTALSLTTVRDRDEFMARAVDESRRVFNADAAAFWYPDEEQGRLIIGEHHGLSERYVAARRQGRGHLESPVPGFPHPFILNDVLKAQPIAGELADEGIHHTLTVPIQNRQRWLGALVLYSRDPKRRFNDDHLHRAATLAAQLALGLDNAIHFAKARQHADQLMALNDVMLEVSRDMDTETTLHTIIERAMGLVHAQGGLIALRDNHSAPHETGVAAASFGGLTGLRLDSHARRLVETVLAGESVQTEDYEAWSGRATLGTEVVGPLLATPLYQGEEVIGLLVILRGPQERPFTPDELWLVELFGKQAAVAVARASMVNEMRRRLQGMIHLRTATLAISQQLDLHTVYAAVVEQACSLLGSPRAALFRPDAESGQLVRVHQSRALAEQPEQFATSAALAAYVYEHGRTIVTHEDNPWHEQISDLPERPGTMVGLPLLYGGKLVGSLVLLGERAWHLDEHSEHILHMFAMQAAVALENALLYQHSEELKKFNENIIQWMDEGILMLDEEGTITYANRAAESLLGYEPGRLVGQHARQILSAADYHHLYEYTPLAAQTLRAEMRLHRATDEILPVIVGSKPLYDAEGNFDTNLIVFTDISERKQLEQRLLQVDKLSAIGELVSGVAHEVNNPLTSIIGYSHLLKLAGLPEAIHHDVVRIESEARRAARIVQNLLAFARQHKPMRQLVNLNELLQSTVDLRAYHLKTLDITVIWQLSPTLPLTSADPHQMQQVFMNLLTNAEQAMAEMGRGGHLTLRTEVVVEGGQPFIQLTVADTGPGMSEATKAHIFDPFFTTKEVGKGTGLGLSICFGIVQEHQGTIEVSSEVGQGCTFTMRLPIQRALLHGAATATLPPLPRAEPTPPPSASILIVDGERTITTVMSQVLRLHGHRVRVVPSGEEAQPLLAEQSFDLVLCEVKLPGMPGAALWEWLCAAHPALAERVLFVTGDLAHPPTHTFLEASGRPWLAKPFRMEELVDRVHEQLQATGATMG